jgi:hypothetical protein
MAKLTSVLFRAVPKMYFSFTPLVRAETCSAMFDAISFEVTRTRVPKPPSASASNETGGVPIATKRLPFEAPAIRTQGAPVVPNDTAPASVRLDRAAMTSCSTVGLL